MSPESCIQQIDDPAISAGYHQHVRQDREIASYADRIIGLLQGEPIPVKLTDQVTLEFYPPSDNEYLEIVQFQADGMMIAKKAKQIGIEPDETDPETVPAAISLVHDARDILDRMNVILSKLSVDPEFTPDAFARMPRKYKQQIFMALSQLYAGEMQKTKSFRGKSKR